MKSSDINAALALLISILALILSLYETNILKQQQKASVWPYLEADTQYAYDSTSFTYTLEIVNKGVGPARINSIQLVHDGQSIEEYDVLFKLINKVVPSKKLRGLSLNTSKGILSPGERSTLITIETDRDSSDRKLFDLFELEYQICYCSIYDECWTVYREETEPRKGCQ